MKIDKRIWKTGAAAAIMTLAGSMFVVRLDEWSRGLSPGFSIFSQAPETAANTKVIPQIAVGSFDRNLSKYTTTIQIVNMSASEVTLSGNFYKATDGTASTLTFETNLTALPAITGGVMPSTPLPANAVMVISGLVAPVGTVNWARIQSTGRVSITAFFEVRDFNTNVLYSRVGVGASVANMSKFIIPRIHNTASGLDVGFAVVNTGTTPATYTATLRNTDGNVLATKANQTLDAGQQKALFVNQLFELGGEPSGKNYGYIVFESQSPQFGALALAFEGATLTSFPVQQLQ